MDYWLNGICIKTIICPLLVGAVWDLQGETLYIDSNVIIVIDIILEAVLGHLGPPTFNILVNNDIVDISHDLGCHGNHFSVK